MSDVKENIVEARERSVIERLEGVLEYSKGDWGSYIQAKQYGENQNEHLGGFVTKSDGEFVCDVHMINVELLPVISVLDDDCEDEKDLLEALTEMCENELHKDLSDFCDNYEDEDGVSYEFYSSSAPDEYLENSVVSVGENNEWVICKK